jgi:4-carboxymuconolactone decarboxylase
MRLEPIAPGQLTPEQRELHDEMKAAIDAHLRGFVSEREDGALIGPFTPLLHFPRWGAGVWAQTRALLEHTVLPKPAHEVAILVTGAATGSRYELYAHQRVALETDLTPEKIASIVAGTRPGNLDPQEGAAYDVAYALTHGAGAVPDVTYDVAVRVFGREGAAELMFLVASYCSVCALLNGFDARVPASAGELEV